MICVCMYIYCYYIILYCYYYHYFKYWIVINIFKLPNAEFTNAQVWQQKTPSFVSDYIQYIRIAGGKHKNMLSQQKQNWKRERKLRCIEWNNEGIQNWLKQKKNVEDWTWWLSMTVHDSTYAFTFRIFQASNQTKWGFLIGSKVLKLIRAWHLSLPALQPIEPPQRSGQTGESTVTR